MQQSPYFVGFIYNWIRLNRVRTGFFRFLETKIVSVSVEARLLPTGFFRASSISTMLLLRTAVVAVLSLQVIQASGN